MLTWRPGPTFTETCMSEPFHPNSVSSTAMVGARSIVSRFARDLWMRPRWHKSVLALAALAAFYGWAHWGFHAATDANPTTAPTVVNNSTAAPPSSPFFAPLARRVGGSILLGFVIGWLFRTFVGVMSAITAVGIGGLALLSYLHIMNVDLTAAENKSTQASAWVTEQAGRLRDAALAHVHSTVGGAVGMLMGVRRRKI
jgi:uncharacterized membrane protein (Fun14 family)